MSSSLSNALWSITLFFSVAMSSIVTASVQDNLPDIGTAAGSTLTISQEKNMGDYYMRQLRGNTPLIYDPLLNNYITQLGDRLVNKAHSVQTPFYFNLVRNDDINAFAFFGGHVVIHSALIRASESESELASVLAHEISHVTQRHLARMMEDQQRSAPFAWAGALGSILLATANPQAGMAALTTTLAGAQQGVISFTQANEQEADRIGIQILNNAGFDSQAMPAFMQKLTDRLRYSSKPPEILLTHPLPENRLSDTRNRAGQLPARSLAPSLPFLLAKARILGMYSHVDKNIMTEWLTHLEKGSKQEQQAAQYGWAVVEYENKKYDNARKWLSPLLQQAPDNIWYLDLITDIDLAQQQTEQAIKRLENALKQQPKSAVLQINLANAYLEGKRLAEADQQLYRYTYNHSDDLNGWTLLAKTNAERGKRDGELAARAEILALEGQLDESIRLLKQASSLAKNGSQTQARYDARIDQLHELQRRFKSFQR